MASKIADLSESESVLCNDEKTNKGILHFFLTYKIARLLAVSGSFKKYIEKQSFDWSKMRDASDDDWAKMREERNKVQAERDKEIKVLLTAEQVKLYEVAQKKREEMRRSGQGRTGSAGGMGGQ